MARYIDKSTLVAEIENRIKELQNLHKENEEKLDSIQKTAILLCIYECMVILSFLDTIEVKEVDLEKEIDFAMPSRYCWSGDGEAVYSKEQMRNFAKHFFELGIKAQKGE